MIALLFVATFLTILSPIKGVLYNNPSTHTAGRGGNKTPGPPPPSLLKCLPLVHAAADPTIWETRGLGLALKVTFAGGTCAISAVPLLTYERRPVSAKRLSWCRFVCRDADAPQAVAAGGAGGGTEQLPSLT